MPTIVELRLSDELVAKKSFPLQTILIHDLGFAACQSANPKTVDRAIEALKPLSNDDRFANRICQFYRINTWQSTIGFLQETATTKNLVPPINITNDERVFEKLRNDWMDTFLNDPKTFFQAKMVFFTQITFSSQSNFPLPSTSETISDEVSLLVSALNTLNKIITFPWVVLAKMFFLSPFSLLVIATWVSYIQLKRRTFCRAVLLMPITILMTILANSLFFVSDNARYVTPFALLALIGLLICSYQDSEKIK